MTTGAAEGTHRKALRRIALTLVVVAVLFCSCSGCGAIRFALGLEERALSRAAGSGTVSSDPALVAEAVDQYGGCQ